MPFTPARTRLRSFAAWAWLLGCFPVMAHAADDFVCPPDARLHALEGYYALQSVIDAAPRLRSWPAVLDAVDAQTAGMTIRDSNVFLSLAWHEGDTGGHCVREDAKGVWLREADKSGTVHGPYQRLASLDEDEALAYLSLFLSGCYASSNGEPWCFSREGIAVDGRRFEALFNLDTTEAPAYGLSLRISDPAQALPLLVFVPTDTGWAVYRDDFVTASEHVPVEVGRTAPLLLLEPVR